MGYRYQLTTYRSGAMTDHARDLHMLTQPAVGARLVMYGGASNRRIVTSPVVRMYPAHEVLGTVFETRNSVYLLQYD
jgi:hypothetical protein